MVTSVVDLAACLGLSAYALFALLSWVPQPRVVMLPMVHPLGRCLLLALVVAVVLGVVARSVVVEGAAVAGLLVVVARLVVAVLVVATTEVEKAKVGMDTSSVMGRPSSPGAAPRSTRRTSGRRRRRFTLTQGA
jgi:hypothetical protein